MTLANCNKPYKTSVFTVLKMPKSEPTNRRSAMAQTDDYDFHDDFAWFRDQLRQRDRLIAELTSELDKSADLIRRFNEYINARKKLGEFEMGLTDLDLETTLGDKDWKLVDDWNKLAPD